MWPTFTNSFSNKDKMTKILNVNDEYLLSVRTKSFADFSVQVQSLVNSPSSSYSTLCHPSLFSDLLLNPGQETIASLLKSSKKTSPHLKSVLSNYFNISAEASSLCTNLLTTLIHLQNNYKFINQILDAVNPNNSCHEFRLAISEYLPDNPFSDLNKQHYFKRAHDRHSSVLQQLRSSREKMAGKSKLIEFLGAALLVGPALLIGVPLKKKLRRSGSLTRRAAEQLDVAAKGAYILKRDFDTIGRLVARIGDEIEHDRAVVEVCLGRGEDRHCLQVLKECEFGVSRQAEELKEHVYLCLVTINRARAMVVREICRNSSENSL